MGWLGLVKLRRVLVQLKKMVEKGYCGTEGLDLAWDCIKVPEIALNMTSQISNNIIKFFCFKQSRFLSYRIQVQQSNFLFVIFLTSLIAFNIQPMNDQCSPSYRTQSIDLQFKSIDWFLYDGEHWSLMGQFSI